MSKQSPRADIMERQALSVPEAVRAMGIGKTMLYAEIGAGRLRAVKCGKRTLIPAASISLWLAALPTA